MLSQRDFVSYIKLIRKEEKRLDKLSSELSTLGEGWVILDNPLIVSTVRLLEKAMQDEYDTISWWLWEGIDKVIYDGDKPIDVSTPQKLYKYLVQRMNLKD